MKNGQRSTIYQIARKARSSPSAVSSALNGTWKHRRLKKETVERILRVAREEGYIANRQARGLRNAQSGLAGLILPSHENRFFAELSQSFAVEAHARGHCPAIVHAGRDATAQLNSVEDLISFAVDLLVIAGATDPDALAEACRVANVPHVFVDHPCDHSPSVVTDNAGSAEELARRLLEEMAPPEPADPRSWLYFVGGDTTSHASSERIEGFRRLAAGAGVLFSEAQIIACGYESTAAQQALADLHARLGQLPGGLFVNSIDCFEGVVRHLAALPEEATRHCRFGCFDHDPFATLLRVPLRMMRQRSERMIEEAFRQLDAGTAEPQLIRIPCELR